MVCAGQLDLTTAQQAIARDWIATYKRYESPNPRLTSAWKLGNMIAHTMHGGKALGAVLIVLLLPPSVCAQRRRSQMVRDLEALKAGKALFAGACSACHGVNGEGGHSSESFQQKLTPALLMMPTKTSRAVKG